MPPKCNQCDSTTINGIYCHEFGCPNWNKIWDEEEQYWVVPELEDDTDEYIWE